MRQIKFRAWAHSSKVMFNPDSDNGWELINGELHPLPNTALMQFTGLQDKNGVAIYEGDVVRSIPNSGTGRITYVNGCSLTDRIIIWLDDDAKFGWQLTNGSIEQSGYCLTKNNCDIFEVIGNKFENPELLTDNN